MLKKKTFEKVIELIRKQEEIDKKISDTLPLFCDGNGLLFTGSKNIQEALMIVLKESMNDEADWIEWWLYEDVEKKVYCKDGEEILLENASQLYDFLATCK